MASTSARVYFALSGYNFDPEIVTEVLDMEPTSMNSAGVHASADSPAISTWEYSTGTERDNIDIYNMTGKLIEDIEPVKDKILKVIESHNLSPRFVAVLRLSCEDEALPDLAFGARSIRFMSEIGAFIDVDYRLINK